MATAIGDLVAKLRMDTRGFRKGARGATGSLHVLGGAARTLTASLLGGGGLAFAFVRMGRSANEFAGAMNRSVAIMTGVNATIRKDMERTALSVAFNTKFSAREAADAYYFLASAGMDVAQSIAALPMVARFAQAGNFDLSLATDLATDALSALGLKSKNAAVNARNLQHVMDNLVKANTLANASVEQFSKALTNKAGAAMKLLGMEIEEGLAVLAVWADQGVKAEDAGTRFEIVMRDLTTKAILNADAFKKANIAVFEFGELRNIADIVEDMERKMGRMTDRGKKATLMQLGFTNKTVSATASLLGASAAIREYEAAQRSAAGTMDTVAENQTNLDKSWAQMGASMQAISNDFFPPVLDGFASLISSLAGSSDEFDRSADSMSNWAIAGQRVADTGSAFAMIGRAVGATATLIANAAGDVPEPEGGVTAWFERQVLGIPEPARPLPYESNERERGRRARRAEEAARPRTATDIFGPQAVDLFGKATRAMGFSLGDSGASAVDDSLPALRKEFQGLIADSETLSRMNAFDTAFDVTKATEELNTLDKRIKDLAMLPQAQAIADLFGWGQVTVGGVGAEAAGKMLPGLKEDFAALHGKFAKMNEDAMKRVSTLGAQMFDETRTPIERYKKQLTDINNLLSLGALHADPKIAADTAARARAEAAETLRQATDDPKPQGPNFAAAMEKSTAAAYSTIVNAGREGERVGKEQLRTQKRTLDEIKGLRRDGNQVDTVVIPS